MTHTYTHPSNLYCICFPPPSHRAAANSLHTMVTNFPAWRHDIVRVFVQFLLRDVPDSCPLVLEAALKALIQFISHWRMLITSPDSEKPPGVG